MAPLTLKADERLPDPARRALAHLAIPRSVADLTHELRIDAASQTWEDSETYDALKALEGEGWVTRFAQEANPGRLASVVQASEAIPLADEQAQILERRRSHPRMSWQWSGETFMLSKAGLEKMREPLVEDRAFTTSDLRDLIAAQWEGVQHDLKFEGSIHDQGEGTNDPTAGGVLINPETGQPFEGNDGPTLLGEGPRWWNPHAGNYVPLPKLLPEEFAFWLKAVVADHEARWGDKEARELRKSLPVAGGSQYSDAYEIIVLDAENQKASITAAAPWYMALSILAFNDADTGTTADDVSHIPTYTGYARKSVAAADMNAGAGTSGSVTNANAIIFAACTAGSSAIVAFAHCSAATVATLRKFGTCSSTTVSTTQTPAQFAAAAYTTTVA